MTAPRIEIDLYKIRYNTRSLAQRLSQRGIRVTGVTKAVCGHPKVAQAMLDGGATDLADARIENVERMRHAEIKAKLHLIRTPMLSQIDQIATECDSSNNTDLRVLEALSGSATRADRVHSVILMVEMGDLREGILPANLEQIARAVLEMPGLTLKGIGACFGCLGGVAPDEQSLAELSRLADELEGSIGFHLDTVSGGNSSCLPWALGQAPAGRINELRLGEAILLGVDPISGQRIEGLFTDAFRLVAEVIESHTKPDHSSSPGTEPIFGYLRAGPNNLQVPQSIIALGWQDTDIGGLTFPDTMTVSGATSDHLVVRTGDAGLSVGAEVGIQPNYSALMRVMNAAGVEKLIFDGRSPDRPRNKKPCELKLVVV
jgi:predicted amino acid racemase